MKENIEIGDKKSNDKGVSPRLFFFASALHLETLPFRFDSLNCTTFPLVG
ncbi:MAG: hypothetical protein IJG18_08335 [Kiritimatiellae bacterium]|nr:hypothetical protein [Kiritimatiellia bacterium]